MHTSTTNGKGEGNYATKGTTPKVKTAKVFTIVEVGLEDDGTKPVSYTPDYVRVTPRPKIAADNGDKPPFYVYPATAGKLMTELNSSLPGWSSSIGKGTLDGPREVGTKITLVEPIEVVAGTYKPSPPPPTPYDDVKANRDANQAEADAILGISDFLLTLGGHEEITAVLQQASSGAHIGTVNLLSETPSTDVAEAAAKALERLDSVQELAELLDGLTADQRKRVMRHIAHKFNIGKGLTKYR